MCTNILCWKMNVENTVCFDFWNNVLYLLEQIIRGFHIQFVLRLKAQSSFQGHTEACCGYKKIDEGFFYTKLFPYNFFRTLYFNFFDKEEFL